MNRKKIIQIIAIIFLLIGVFLLFPNTNWEERTSIYGFISVICGTLGSTVSIFIPSVFVYNFEEQNWNKKNEGYSITVLAKEHGMGKSPQIQSFILNDSGFQEVFLNQKIDFAGSVFIHGTRRFNGKVVIK
ncbi:hypothetical protein LV84_02149 [Algoriphagus ratkowskyi]|uniref:Uncharacterized protein n=1 Tax=Algoriphagus ratkowskyi TaxID=57028 RepID=A0A2W7R834_9BACT|nr:hypothetical protein [Algoriphagus ratkowskyi]PZX57018.1 hypothetical protein LV84_02149 [Algoriphagus ratkowskyi]TXD79921.1 hypothetical protein ESW18_01960 [Algoriphagus ratkowskyi]